MSLLLNCGSTISKSAPAACGQDMGQIQKIWITRKYKTGTTKNGFTAIATTPLYAGVDLSGGPTSTTPWDTLFAGPADGTDVIISPDAENVSFTPGEPIQFGGGNQTLNGIQISMGYQPTVAEGMFYQLNAQEAGEMRALQGNVLAAYLIDEHDRIWGIAEAGLAVDGTAGEFYPIPIYEWSVSARTPGGFEEPDGYRFRFAMRSGWDEELYSFTPSGFTALDKANS